MPRNKQSLAKRAVTLALALCMVFTTAAQSLGAVAYADSTSTAISSSVSVDPGVPESMPESESTPVEAALMIRQAYRLLNPMRTAPAKRTQVLCRLNRKATRILTAVRPLRMLILRQVLLKRPVPAANPKTAMNPLQIVSRNLTAVPPVSRLPGILLMSQTQRLMKTLTPKSLSGWLFLTRRTVMSLKPKSVMKSLSGLT